MLNWCNIRVLSRRSWRMHLVVYFLMIFTYTHADYPAFKALLSEKGLRNGEFYTILIWNDIW